MLEMLHITKRFGPLAALDDVSLRIEPGHVHGLLGENGAGKSTLMNILFGLLAPDAGIIRMAGQSESREVRITSPRTAQALGIGMVHQHFKLVPTLGVLENLALALHVSVRNIRPRARQIMEELHWSVPLAARIDGLSVGQQQRVEIIKALLAIRRSAAGKGPRTQDGDTPSCVPRPQHSILILDEPTAVLTPQETAELFTAISALRSAASAIVFISHKLAEVQKICDTLTILRRGKHVHTGPAHELSADQMAQKMVGTSIELPHLERTEEKGLRTQQKSTQSSVLGPQPCVLELDRVTSGMLRDASLQVHRGEILGIAGVDGNGQSDLVQAIVGPTAERPITAGRILIDGIDATHRSTRWRTDRLAYIPEDRHLQALILPMSVQQNLLLKEYRTRPFSAAGFLRFSAWRSRARSLVRQFDIRANSIADPAASLSGGNQQKVVLARELHADRTKPLVIAVNPTRGLDIGATAFVMRQLLAAREKGAAVLLIHSDLDELLALSDRLAVLYNGTLAPSPWPRDTREGIGRLMLGVK